MRYQFSHVVAFFVFAFLVAGAPVLAQNETTTTTSTTTTSTTTTTTTIAATTTTTAPCPTGMTRCGSVCTDTRYDSSNCGYCGLVCSASTGATCNNGICSSATTTTTAAACTSSQRSYCYTESACSSVGGYWCGYYCQDVPCPATTTTTYQTTQCSLSTPGLCYSQSQCTGVGANWCGSYCTSASCPTCSSSQKYNCYSEGACTGAGGKWCQPTTSGSSGYCSDSCPTCSSSQFYYCYTQSACTGAGGYWCNTYCQGSPCSGTTTTTGLAGPCSEGPISTNCRCDGTVYYFGYCCSGKYQGTVCGTPTACQPGQTICNGYCTNTASDNANCGGCGKSCGQYSYCSNGVCTSSSTTTTYPPTQCNKASPWNCYGQNECTGVGANWCGSYCTTSSCPTCTKEQIWNCYTKDDCTRAGASWCVPPGGVHGSCYASCPSYKCSATEPWNCIGQSECTAAGAKWCTTTPTPGATTVAGYCSSSCPTETKEFCGNYICGFGETAQSCPSDCKSSCAAVYDPVCGTDGGTYSNDCEAKSAGVAVGYKGKCQKCGDGICAIGEDPKNCFSDCKVVCPQIQITKPDSESCRNGRFVPQNDKNGCLIGYSCETAACGDGRCEVGESPQSCKQDCLQTCIAYAASPLPCDRGYLIPGKSDPSGCPGPSLCCGDDLCNFGEDSFSCPADCGKPKPFCGNGFCDIGEDQTNCFDDCARHEEELPPECHKEFDPVSGFSRVECETEHRCPTFDVPVEKMKADCVDSGGSFVLRGDGHGCDFPDCQFVEESDNPFQGQRRCMKKDDVRAVEKLCRNLETPILVDVHEGCTVAKCGHKEERRCKILTDKDWQREDDKCRREGKASVSSFDPAGCEEIRCGQGFECPKELPDEAYVKCAEHGGELIVDHDERGCVVYSECVEPGDDRDVYIEPIEEVPDATELLDIAFKLENLKIQLDKLAQQVEQIADYYKSTGSTEYERFARVADMFRSAKDEVDRIKEDIREKIDDITVDDMMEIKRDIRYIKDVTLKDIVYMMLSKDKEVKDIGDKKVKDCKTDGACFDRAFRVCKPVKFLPEGREGPKVEVIGLEGDACIMKASMDEEFGPPPGFIEGIEPPYEMTCKISDYARGIRRPETDVFPYCEGSLLELIKKFGAGGPPPEFEEGGHREGAEFGGPGGCRGEQECRNYCSKPQNLEECRRFAEAKDFGEKEHERFEAPGGFSGPGGCSSPRECREFCSSPKNFQECTQFIDDKGFGQPPRGGEFERLPPPSGEFERFPPPPSRSGPQPSFREPLPSVR